MSHAIHRIALPLAVGLVACKPADTDAALRPSLTMLRVGEVVVEDPPPIPEERYLPGIVVNTEDVVYEGEALRRGLDFRAPPPPPHTDLSAMADLDDPTPLEKHATSSTYAWATAPGNLTDGTEAEDALSYDDVEQGAIGDCYLAAALSSAFYADADNLVRDGLIRPNLDEQGQVVSFAVRFYDAWGDPQDVLLDGQILRKSGRPVYLRSMDSDSQGEEWGPSLIEKAYAKWHGTYDKIGNGGWAGDVLQAMTGATATYKPISRMSDSSLQFGIQDAVEDKRAVVAGTFGEDDGVDYSGTGVYAWHAYSVLGAEERDGVLYIKLRNPWGSSEPAGNGPDDGIFDLDVATFRKLYQGITFGGATRRDVTAPAAIDDLAVKEVVGDRALLTFTATGDDGSKGLAAAYDVRVSDAPITASNFYNAAQVSVLFSPAAPGTVQTLGLRDDRLAQGTTLYVAMRVEDESDNLSPVSNVATIAPSSVDRPVYAAGFFEFESAEEVGDWVAAGLWHASTAKAKSGETSFRMGVDGTRGYAGAADVTNRLESPAIDLTEASFASLLFESLLDVAPGTGRDRAWVEVASSADDFTTWHTVWSKDDVGTAWQVAEGDLSDFLGTEIVLAFVFAGGEEGSSGEGWYVDDVWVYAE